jgi:hypothetical protein
LPANLLSTTGYELVGDPPDVLSPLEQETNTWQVNKPAMGRRYFEYDMALRQLSEKKV